MFDSSLSEMKITAKQREGTAEPRRKIVARAIVLETARLNAAFGTRLWRLVDEFVDNPLERALFISVLVNAPTRVVDPDA